MFSTILYCMAQVPFSMTLSTIFKEPKVGNGIGGMIVWAVFLIPLQLTQLQNSARFLLYPFCLFPVSAGIVIWSNVVDNGMLET